MLLKRERAGYLLLLILIIFSYNRMEAVQADTVILYTPYTKITVSPGQSIDYAVDLINNGSKVISEDLTVTGLPRGWEYTLKANNYNIKQLSSLPGEKQSCTLALTVPLKVNKGTYNFSLNAGKSATLHLTVVVAEQGTFRAELVTEQANMEGPTSSTFNFETVLKNYTADKQMFALVANAPRGWNVSFSADYKKVTSVELTPNNTTRVNIEIDPPDMVEARSYKIPVRAIAGSVTAQLDLEVVITGTYEVQLTTPTGLLSASITAGEEKKIELEVKNTGTAELSDIKIASETPINWEVSFEPAAVQKLAPGNSATVYATIKPSKKAIAGDYAVTAEAKTPEASSKAAFRISIKTPLLTGWLGILIIIGAAGSVFYLFRKYGRR